MTYKEAFDNYKMTKNKNIFEDLCSQMILENKTLFTEEYQQLLNQYGPRKRRGSILSRLTNNRELFLEIAQKAFKQNLPKFEYMKQVLEMLREYVKVGEVERKLYGEIMTPIELVEEMLSHLPKSVWSNPNLKWLDPCNGSGPFLAYVIKNLMNGLSSWCEDEEKRYKHIIENMIYSCELQAKNQFIYLCLVDPWDCFSCNVYTGSFLDKGFDTHQREVWGVEKFDIILGNPPYQEPSTSETKSSDQGRVKLWMKFVDKSLLIGHKVFFITPNNWMSKTCHLQPIFSEKLVLCEIDSNYLKNKYFKGVGSQFSYYLLFNDKQVEKRKILSSSKVIDLDLFSLKLLPTKDITIESISIFNKVQSKGLVGVNFIREKYHLLPKSELCISIDRSKNRGFVKNDNSIKSTSSYWHICSNQTELDNLYQNLNTKFYKFLIKNIRSGMAVVSTITDLPLLKDRVYDDKELYEFFELNGDEIDLIQKS